MPTLAVIIPSYNRVHLLKQTLHSLALQTSSDFEVLLFDHGSTDETSRVFHQWSERLALQYHYLPRIKNDPGKPRDLAGRHATTPLIAFLDCGIVVPPSYVASHIQFHTNHRGYVGLGFYHGHEIDYRDRKWLPFLHYINNIEPVDVDKLCEELLQDPDFSDIRKGMDLSTLNLPWGYGWTGNMSLWTRDYLAVGGFDPEQGYGFEDLDLSYRLFKYRLRFAFVENGWGIHLPHPRSLSEIREMELSGWQLSYLKHRSLALEALNCANIDCQNGERIFDYLTKIGTKYNILPPIPEKVRRTFPHPSLLIGGKIQDEQFYDHIALSNDEYVSTHTLWSCCGILIPLANESLASVIVTDAWKWLGHIPNVPGGSLLERLVAEIKRTAKEAFFLNSSQLAHYSDCYNVTLVDLESLCHKYNLSYKIISFE